MTFTSTVSDRPENARLEMFEPGTWRTLKQRSYREQLIGPVVVDLNNDASPEILTIHNQDEIWVFNSNLEVIKRRKIIKGLMSCTVSNDVTGDGEPEIIVHSIDDSFLLDTNLNVLACGKNFILGKMIKRGLGNPPYLLGLVKQKPAFLKLKKNSYYFYYQYKNLGFTLLVVVVGFIFISRVNTFHRRHKILQTMLNLVVETEDRGLILLHPGGHLLFANQVARKWFNWSRKLPAKKWSLEAFLKQIHLDEFLMHMQSIPPRRFELETKVALNKTERSFKVVAEPIQHGKYKTPYWILIFEDLTAAGELK